MKNLLIVTNLLTLGGLAYSLNSNKQVTTNSNCETCFAPNCDAPFDGLQPQLAQAMIANYRDKQWAAINNAYYSNGESDSRCTWFSLPTLKRYIYEIESKSEKVGNCDKALGIRMYYGTYPDNKSLPGMENVPDNYLGRQTIMMVPTMRVGEDDLDFDPNYMNGQDRKDYKELLVTAPISGNLTMQNHGTMMPPPFAKDSICTGARFMHFVDRDPVNCN
jgi:hypothetical protein